MGVVYKAMDPTIGRSVAIKSIRLSEFQDSDERERIHQRLWREARSAGVLSHPNIVTIFDVVEQNSAAYIVMEYVSGQSLGHLFRRGALPERADLLRYLRQVAEALDYAHQRGVVHRDVKPGNIIISELAVDGKSLAKVADFGVAKFISQDTTHSGTMIGTPSYISPEQIEGAASDGRADQFSLAVVIYELLTGQKPFDSENLSGLFYQICKQSPKPAEQLNPLLSTGVGKALARGLAKEPDQRFPTCSDLLFALESSFAVQAEVRVPLEPIIELPPIRPRRSRMEEDTDVTPRRRVPAAAWFAGGAAVLVALGLALYRPSGPSAASPPAPAPSSAPATPKKAPAPTEHDDRKPAQTQVKVPAEPASKQTASTTTPTLLPVTFETDPGGAAVEVDDRPDVTCTSPCTVHLSSGRHTLEATAAGFNVARRIFNVPGESDLSITLERSMGVLLITSQPSGSNVIVDGKPSGQTPVTLHLSAGPHQVELTRGNQRHEETITLQTDEFASRNLRWQ